MKHKLLAVISLVIAIGLVLSISVPSVSASGNIVSISLGNTANAASPEEIKDKALDEYKGSAISEKTTNQYEIAFDGTKSKIEIGDAQKSTNFKPDLTISHWNGEVSFKLIAPVDIESKSQLSTSLNSLSKSVTATSGQWTFEYKVTEPKAGFNEYGGLDIIISAKEKPDSNKIYFTYDSSTATPYYQGELTEAEIKEGCVRPDYVVGSIALYANDKANYGIGGVNYGTGKIGHLYAMYIGKEACRWSIDRQFIVLTIPQEIIDKGTYPIIIAPIGDTFGITSVGGTASTYGANYWRGELAAPTYSGTVTSIQIYTSAGSGNSKAVLCDTSLNIISNGTGNGIAASGNPGWMPLTYTTAPTVVGGTSYWIGAVWDAANGYELYYDTVTADGTHARDTSNSYTTPTNPTDAATNRTTKISLKCIYTPSATYALTNAPDTEALGLLAVNTTYYAYGSAPSNPVADGECTFTITNTGSICDVNIHGHNFTGGVGWTLGASVGQDIVKITVYDSGTNPASGIVVTTSDQKFIDSLAASGTKKWDFKFETGTFTDGVAKSGILTVTAVAET